MSSRDQYILETWRVDLRTRAVRREPFPASWQRLGGRGLSARILLDEINPVCEPLGPGNKLIFAPGLLVGHMLSSTDRISIGGKSPLTGGIKEANAGGRTGLQMAQLGVKALILENQPVEPGWWVLFLDAHGARFESADDLAGLGVYQTSDRLLQRYGDKVAIALIGPGAEMKLRSAGIQNLDRDKVPSRIAARGGLGAVMATKGLKAIIFDGASGQKPPLADPATFRKAQKEFNQALIAHPQVAVYKDYGTAAMTMMTQTFGALPTRNFSSGQFESAEDISGESLRDLLLARGGQAAPSHACMPGCIIQCSNIFADTDGNQAVSPLEYETISLMGSNLGLSDFDIIARLNWEVNDLGLDSIEVGAALGVAAEAGLAQFGDGLRFLELLGEIRQGTPLGRLIASGAATVGQVLGVERVPVAKGQAFSGYEPRAIKGTGVTYATSPMGADHTAGLTIRAKVDHLDPQGQAALSRTAQINMAGYDTLGACIFAGNGFAAAPRTISALLNARYGWDAPADILQVLGRETLTLEREFNRRAGFTPAHDRLPEWMTREPIPPTNAVFDVSEQDLDSVFNW